MSIQHCDIGQTKITGAFAKRNYRLFTVEGLINRKDNKDRLGDLSGLFAFIKPLSNGATPHEFIGITEDENGEYLPVVIRTDIEEYVKEAFFSKKPLLIAIHAIPDFKVTVADAVIPLKDEVVAAELR